MSSSLRPQYFCSRPNGTLVPLVAVDELPPSIYIHGAPGSLSPAETQGMTSLGALSPRGQIYMVEGLAINANRPLSTGGTNQRPHSHDLKTELISLINDDKYPADERNKLQTLIQHGFSIWQMNNASTAGWLVPKHGGGPGNGTGQQTNSRNAKKEFCSYWIRHGECDYQQQGCLFKHQMPMDKEGLEKVGLRDIPKWYRDKEGVSSLLPNGHAHPRPQTANHSNWKNDAPLKTIQYPAQLRIDEASQRSGSDKTVDQRSVAYHPAQHPQQATGFAGSSQMAFNPMFSPMTPYPQSQAQNTSPGQLNTGNRKLDLMSFDHPANDYMSSNNLLFRPSNETNLNAPRKTPHEELVHSLHSLTMSPGLPSAEYPSSPFDPISGPSRFSNGQRPRRLYEGNQDDIPNAAELAEINSVHAYHDQITTSSNNVSPASKATGSQLTSPGQNTPHGSATSFSPPRDASPTSKLLTGVAVPDSYLRHGHNKGPRRAFDAFGGRNSRNKRSGESSEDDLKK
ncbi:hypothetical protein BDV06DRAFT_223302 [Aspergillus oleicola]